MTLSAPECPLRQERLGLMPDWLVEQRMRAHPGSFRRCLPDWRGPDLPVTLLYPHGHLPRRVRAFVAHLRSSVPMAWPAAASTLSGAMILHHPPDVSES